MRLIVESFLTAAGVLAPPVAAVKKVGAAKGAEAKAEGFAPVAATRDKGKVKIGALTSPFAADPWASRPSL